MSETVQHPGVESPALFEDEFESYLQSAQRDPKFRAAFEDASELQAILDSLVKLRKALGLTQTAVAARMGVRQPTVSGFETETSDPRLSTLQRYARAVESRVRLSVEMPAACDLVSASRSAYDPNEGSSVADPRPEVCRSSRARQWTPPRPGAWALVA